MMLSLLKRLLIILIIIATFFITVVKAQYINPGSWPLVTTPTVSIKNIDHNSEGFLVTLNNGDILNIFRIDTGFTGNHTGNSGKIVKRYSSDGGNTWTIPETIYDSPYDDRNINGGITENGKIVCFFRRYNANTYTHIDLNVMFSNDDGITWSAPQAQSTISQSPGMSNIFGNNSIGYYNSYYTSNYVELLHSNNGILWDSVVFVWDYRFSHQYLISEPCFEYLGNGVIIGLWRNESGILGENFLQVESYDFGRTWTEPQFTNIADGYFCPSPWMFYDSFYNELWVIATDRRGDLDSNHIHNQEEVWLYKVTPEEILNNPLEYKLFINFLRPTPSFYRFYGYPYSARKSNGDYLILFTDNYHRSNTPKGECAYLYQFDILYNSVEKINDNNSFTNTLHAYPNPFADNVVINGNFNITNNSKISLSIYNSLGEKVYFEEIEPRIDNSYMFNVNSLNIKSGIYLCKVESQDFNAEKTIVKQ